MLGDADKLAWMVRESVRAALLNVHTSIPGVIQSYDRTTFKATVKPALKRTFPDGKLDPPPIENVPVLFPRFGNAFLRLPVAVGNPCLLLFSERSLDVWLQSGGASVDPQDQRMFDLSDAMCLPGLWDFGHPPPADAGADDSAVLFNNGALVEVKSAGTFRMLGGNGDELLQLIADLISKLLSAVPVCGGIPGDFDPGTITNFTALQNRINALKG